MSEQETIVIDGRKTTDVIRTVMGVGGLVALVIGVLILINPVESGAVMMGFVAIMFAIYMVVAGLVFLGSMIFSKTMPSLPHETGWSFPTVPPCTVTTSPSPAMSRPSRSFS